MPETPCLQLAARMMANRQHFFLEICEDGMCGVTVSMAVASSVDGQAADTLVAYIAMTNIVSAYIAMAYIGMAYI